MDERRKKRRGPITIFVDWFMVDPVITGVLIAILLGFASWMAYLMIRYPAAGRF